MSQERNMARPATAAASKPSPPVETWCPCSFATDLPSVARPTAQTNAKRPPDRPASHGLCPAPLPPLDAAIDRGAWGPLVAIACQHPRATNDMLTKTGRTARRTPRHTNPHHGPAKARTGSDRKDVPAMSSRRCPTRICSSPNTRDRYGDRQESARSRAVGVALSIRPATVDGPASPRMTEQTARRFATQYRTGRRGPRTTAPPATGQTFPPKLPPTNEAERSARGRDRRSQACPNRW